MDKHTENRIHLEKYLQHFFPEMERHPQWKYVKYEVKDRERGFYVNIVGVTRDDRYFFVAVPLDDEGLGDEAVKAFAYARSALDNGLFNLDSFLDKRCECKPTPGQFEGEHCPFHKKLFGY